jgi:hypothetical protein
MANLPHHRPYGSATVAEAAEAWPHLHPAQASMRAMGSGARPVFTAAELAGRRDRELAFWANLPGASDIRDRISRGYAEAIAAAERREARASQVERIDAALDQTETALGRCCGTLAATAATAANHTKTSPDNTHHDPLKPTV